MIYVQNLDFKFKFRLVVMHLNLKISVVSMNKKFNPSIFYVLYYVFIFSRSFTFMVLEYISVKGLLTMILFWEEWMD